MNEPIEILITSDSSGALWTCCAWDYHTGANLMTYKGGGSANNYGLDLIRNEFLISANSTRPLLHIWPINSQDQVSGLRFVVPGKVNALTISPDGNYLIAGIQETVYIWQICSGKMLNAISKHYQNISVVKFTSDGSHFVTAGQDGCVLVWNLTKIVGLNNSSGVQQHQQQLQPLYSFNDHALPVTDLHIGYGGIRAYMCTVSLDRTCLIYDLSCGAALLNLVFEMPLTCVVMNSIETAVYVGTTNGQIYEFSIVSPPRTKEYHVTDDDQYKSRFIGHKDKITCLALSVDGDTLVSGSVDENVHVWNIKSRQLLRTIGHKGSISNVKLLLETRNIFNPEHKFELITNNLKRMIDSSLNSDDSHVIEIMVNKSSYEEDEDEENIITNFGSIVGSSNSNTVNHPAANNNKKDVDGLKKEIEKLKKSNKKLFNYSVSKIIKGK